MILNTQAWRAYRQAGSGQATGRDQAVHTAQDISVFAYSSGSHAYRQFYGVQQNIDVFFKLMRAVLGGY